LEYLNILKTHFLKFLNFFEVLKKCSMVTQTSVFQRRTLFSIVIYLPDNFSENVDYQNSNSNKYLLSYLTLCTNNNWSTIIGLEDMGAMVI